MRQLRKNPGFAGTAIVVLGLGMCASVAIFAFVDAALIRPLPYPNPERLAGVYERVPMIPEAPLSYPDYLDWKRMNDVFASLDVYYAERFRADDAGRRAAGAGRACRTGSSGRWA